MGIAAEIVKFFDIKNANIDQGQSTPKSLDDFVSNTPYYKERINLAELMIITRNLTAQGILVPAGNTFRGSPPLNETYYAFSFKPEAAEYGIYDFLAFGFPKIREDFAEAVRVVDVTKANGEPDIGSGFLLETRVFVTAAHCIKNMTEIKIPGWNPTKAPLINIWIPNDTRLDLAVLQFDGDPFPGIPGFRFQDATLLDDVLTMGYPPIPGFMSPLVAETAQIAGHLKSTTGQIVAEEKSYLDQQTYFLISARVKGGNSGGPVIGRMGGVVAVISQLPAEMEGRADTLGYACAIPATTLLQVLEACLNQSDLVQRLTFQTTSDGFSTALDD